jgi:phosphoribosylamine---glycine ligase
MVLDSLQNTNMKILVIGGGGREHAVVWKLVRSASVEKVWCAPGNAGIAGEVKCMPLDVKDPKAAADLAAELGADLTIVGPELPLVAGIRDEFAKRGRALLGPTKAAAKLEGSKIFAKQFMAQHGIPTAAVYGISESPADAYAALKRVKWPLVIKADGLCAGKGVLVTASQDEARAFIERLMERHEFGAAGSRVLVEEALAGDELSYIILTDGMDFIRMAPARDHKRAFDHDEGPNTGGMGAYSVDEILPAELENRIIETIVRPTLEGLKADGIEYQGFLYFGLMLTAKGPEVLEYNCRLGDPETEAVLLRANFDFGQACLRAATGSLSGFEAKWTRGASVCVVIASKGYPGDPEIGVAIEGLEDAAKVAGAVVFHAGTKREGATCRTSGGRVLVVSAAGEDLASARETAYDAVSRIQIPGSFHRTDIGPKNIERKDIGNAKTAR